MRNGSIAGIIFLWVCVAFLASIAEERNVMTATMGNSSTTNVATLFIVLHPERYVIIAPLTWFGALWNVLTLWFDGSLWAGQWIWAYYAVILCIVAGVGWEVFTTILSTVFQLFGSLLRQVGALFTGG